MVKGANSAMKTISQEDIVESIRNENPWWESAQLQGLFGQHTPRPYIDLFYPLVTKRSIQRAVVLMGPRRVGKTVMIHHAIQKLLDEGQDPKHICYISTDHPLYNGLGLEKFLKLFQLATDTDFRKTDCYVFFDEIQYLKDWEKHLKAIVDKIPTVKCVVSGSAAAALSLKSNESGAGRFTDFLLPPLTFHEYLKLQEKENSIKLDENFNKSINQLNKDFVNYINYGGYPEVIFSKEIQKSPTRYIKSDIIDKVLLRDIPQLYGIQDIQELNSLFTTLAYNTADEVSLDALSQSSGVSKNTIKKYIEYLEAAFLIKTIKRVDESGKRFQRNKSFKIYLTNPSMRSAIYKPVSSDEDVMGHMVETAIFSQWFHTNLQELYYVKWKKKEIDLVFLKDNQKVGWILESKWSDRYINKVEEIRHIVDYCHFQKLDYAIITSRSIFKGIEIEGVYLDFVPASYYCYMTSQNLLSSKFD